MKIFPSKHQIQAKAESIIQKMLADEVSQITHKTHPKFYEAVEQLCLMNGIHTLPRMFIFNSLNYMSPAATIPSRDVILFSPEFIAKTSTPEGMTEALAAFSHEMGHILHEDHKRMPKKARQWKEPRKPFELEADQMSVHLMGSHKPMLDLREKFTDPNHDYSINVAFDKLMKSTGLSKYKLAERYMEWLKNKVNETSSEVMMTHYGSFPEQKANIHDVDVYDRSHLDALIKRRNNSTASLPTKH